MTPASLKQLLIKERMKIINVTNRAYFIRNENNIRLCHLEGGEYKYLTFPFCDCEALTTAAQILKEARIVDDFEVKKLSELQFYVVLLRNKRVTHVNANGIPEIVFVPRVMEWNDLRLTRTDAARFIATFEVNNAMPPTTPRSTPAINMYAYKTGVLKMPANNPILKRA